MTEMAAPSSATKPATKGRGLFRDGLMVVSAALMAVTLWMIFFYVPTEANLGVSQRIFYFHVPLGWLGMLSIVIVAFAALMHLKTQNPKWDALAYSAAEFGVIFATLIIVTGAIWAKPVWGVWWTWDAKLTTTLILWFIYVSYLMLRAYGPKGSQGSRYSSVLALIGAIDAPIIYLATVWWRTAHPELVIGPSAESGGLESRMQLAFLISVITFTVMYAYLLWERYSLRRQEDALDEVHQTVSLRA
ncbi:MAG: cytochrome c biogenesis protein CcsA [Chloroflexi bacterium]|nr:cytochrome c biogenesis protein CcsA [Chloroflexota bacterium]